MAQPLAHFTRGTSLLAGFEDYKTIRSDPDLAPARGRELDELLGRCGAGVVLDVRTGALGRGARVGPASRTSSQVLHGRIRTTGAALGG